MKLIHSILVILIIAITTFAIVSRDKKNLDINIKIPNTDNYKLNKIINNEVNKYKLEFIKNAKDSKLKTKYHLYIDYKEYKYGNYVSYVFFIEDSQQQKNGPGSQTADSGHGRTGHAVMLHGDGAAGSDDDDF